ncbi:hypothetical protein NI17_017730 [Thermobifida halotolerans]|uniref:Uncharacterized protein n=1 Tax=Thermobifida halotolerans TaxID=483545 RepID=A0AA97LV27_9ACTN|nr:hypothetical protein [Thermobifida halotolerans]UOE18637.1 hypothetical protein NI17_017730 [Thermobifida halotolerans]
MSVLGRLGIYGLVLVAVFGIAFWAGTLTGPTGTETAPATMQEQEH